ncbi:MAG: hypothetical protein ACK5LK_11965, partial [Chthoniobacterales bacterium]
MLEPELITLFVRPLEGAKVRYMVSGSVASIVYGEPRATMDIDIGIYLPGDFSLLEKLYPAEEFYLPPLEVIEIESRRELRGHYNIIHHNTGFKADFYPSRNHPMLPWALKNVRRIEIQKQTITFAPPEYVIFWKLAFY